MVSPEIQRGGIKIKSAYNSAIAARSTASSRSTRPSAPSTSSAAACSASNDEEEARRVAIIGADATAQLFGTRDSLGQRVYLNGLPYTVIGKIRKKDQDSSYSGPDNDKVFVPFSAMLRDFPRPDAEPGVLSNLIVSPHQWVVDQLPAVLDARTGRIEDVDWPLEQEVGASWRRGTASIRPIATPWRCGTRRSRR